MLMKRLLMMMLLVMATMGVNAQVYVCTGDNVLVRKGPGKNYPVNEGFTNWYQTKKRYGRLCKGDIVALASERKNGYIRVYNLGGGNGDYNLGWVSAQYLKRACNKCENTDWFLKVTSNYIPACRTCGRRAFSDNEQYP